MTRDTDTFHPTTSTIRQITVEVVVSVGQARARIGELLELQKNAVLPLNKRFDDPVDIMVGGRLIARGELREASSGPSGQLEVCITEVLANPDEPT